MLFLEVQFFPLTTSSRFQKYNQPVAQIPISVIQLAIMRLPNILFAVFYSGPVCVFCFIYRISTFKKHGFKILDDILTSLINVLTLYIVELRVSIDSVTEPELPSPTIETLDFTTEEISTLHSGDTVEVQKPVLESSFSMLELGSFSAVLYNVSHSSLDGIFFPSSPVPIVGRIQPSVAWDYIDKMKKTKVCTAAAGFFS